MPAVPENRADRHVRGRPSLAMGAPLQPRHGRHQLRERRSGASLGRKPAGRRASLTRMSQGCRIADVGASSTWASIWNHNRSRSLPSIIAGFWWLPMSSLDASIAVAFGGFRCRRRLPASRRGRRETADGDGHRDEWGLFFCKNETVSQISHFRNDCGLDSKNHRDVIAKMP